MVEPYVYNILVCSTGHLTAATWRNLDHHDGVFADRLRYGWLMFVPEVDDESTQTERDWPPELRTIVTTARTADCDYILFDQDAPPLHNVATFDG